MPYTQTRRQSPLMAYIQGYEDMLKGDHRDMTCAKRDGYKEEECERRIQFIKGQQLAVKKIKSKVRELGL